MNHTALGARKTIIFIGNAHGKFYYGKLKQARKQDICHKALVCCLGNCKLYALLGGQD